jgi:hypothetical protein
MHVILSLYCKEISFTDSKRIKIMNGFINERYVSFSRHYSLFILFQKLLNILNNENIDYFITTGLLIGLFRHNNSFIPWDDDIDICVFEKDKEKLLQSISKYENLYVTVSPIGIHKFTDTEYFDNEQIFIDIFFIKEKEEILHYADDRHIELWPKEYFCNGEIFPLQNLNFNLYLPDGKIFQSIKVNVPNKSFNFLDRAYPNWQNEYIIARAHNSFYKLFPDKKIVNNVTSIQPSTSHHLL